MTTQVFERESTSTNGSGPMLGDGVVGPRRRRRWGRTTALVGVGLLIGVAAFLYDPRHIFDANGTATGSVPRETATVGLASLGEEFTAEGSVVFGGATSVTYVVDDAATTTASAGDRGTAAVEVEPDPAVVTDVVSQDTTIERGDVLWRIGNESTVVLYGELPAYRSLERTAEGPDVAQLEANLVALGYDPDETVTVDEEFTSATEGIVERWQEDIGADITGEVALGRVVYVTGPSRVGVVAVEPGDIVQDGTVVLETTSLEREVQFGVPASERDTLSVGDNVGGRLPDRSSVDATVTSMTVADDGGAAVTATPTETIDYLVDSVPGTITWSVSTGTDVVTVPAAALIRTDAGVYHVEVVEADGSARLVPVTVAGSSGPLVEVNGDIEIGATVVAP